MFQDFIPALFFLPFFKRSEASCLGVVADGKDLQATKGVPSPGEKTDHRAHQSTKPWRVYHIGLHNGHICFVGAYVRVRRTCITLDGIKSILINDSTSDPSSRMTMRVKVLHKGTQKHRFSSHKKKSDVLIYFFYFDGMDLHSQHTTHTQSSATRKHVHSHHFHCRSDFSDSDTDTSVRELSHELTHAELLVYGAL